jgi:2-methylcitrate dehydratase PrpD
MVSSAIATAASHAADRLAAYAAGPRYEHLPADIVAAAKTCLVDVVACVIFGGNADVAR